MSQVNLEKFIKAQQHDFDVALSEIKNGRKQSHWMWYIFPQIHGLGFSETSKFYSIKSIEEAEAFLNDPVLGPRLIEISNALLGLNKKDANKVFGSPDDLKLQSSMTLFSSLSNSNPVFQQVLDQYFGGKKDKKTLQILNEENER